MIKKLQPMIIILAVSVSQAKEQKALVRVPLAEASGRPIADYKGDVAAHYDEFPFAPEVGSFACCRIHQLKFNEVVTITLGSTKARKKIGSSEVACDVSNLHYRDDRERKRTRLWTLEKSLISFDELSKKIEGVHIPPPIDTQKLPEEYNSNVLTLMQPWYDEKTQKTYSVGTRFVRCTEDDTQDAYAIYILDTEQFVEHRTSVDKKLAVVDYPKDPRKAISLFLKILRKWAHLCNSIIPYVYGGCSFIKSSKPLGFALKTGKRCGRISQYWMRNGEFGKPFAGFDCSNMILCAAQIVGMPYYYKNTYAMIKSLAPLKLGQALEEGDLLWYSGHVMVVSNIKKNLLIEAEGYRGGYGKMHEIQVSKVFRGIENYEQLIHACHTKRHLKRLDNRGKPFRSIYRLRIFKLKSIWPQGVTLDSLNRQRAIKHNDYALPSAQGVALP